MSRTIESILSEVREATENEEFDDVVGLTDEELIRYVNDAQFRLHAKIIAQHPSIFTEQEEISLVSGTKAYDINFKAHLGNRILKVEYSSDGSADNYVLLKADRYRNQRHYTQDADFPVSYYRVNGQIILDRNPATSNGKIRVTYIRRPRRLDKKRVQLSGSPTLTASETWTVAAVNSTTIDAAELAKHNKVTVVDSQGVVKASNILVSSTSATSVVLDSTYASVSGETVASGDFIIPGDFSSFMLEFREEVTRYIRAYVEWKILKRDSSVDSQEAMGELSEMEADIIDSYADVDGDDLIDIPEMDDTCLLGDWM